MIAIEIDSRPEIRTKMTWNRTSRPDPFGPHAPRALAACLFLLAIIGGCGEEKGGTELVPASAAGKVLLPDGSPMSGGKIIFQPDEEGFPKVDAPIKGDGTFAIEKAMPGLYNIAIDNTGSAPSMPVKYKSILTSGLTATLKAGPNDLTPFKLDNLPPASPNKGASRVSD